MTHEPEEFFTARGYEISAGEDELTPSMEDYLEMIFRESAEAGYTRVHDLAARLNVQPPSVTKMMQKLAEKKLLSYEKYGIIQLTDEGRRLGKYFLVRHNTLKSFLQQLGIPQSTLQKDVEKMEHHISFAAFEALSAFLDFLRNNPEIIANYAKHRENKFSAPQS